jgi:predicted small secreted protein
MRKSIIPLLISATALLGACNMVRGVGQDVESVATALDPTRTYAACGNYGSMDRNNDGFISNTEWNSYRTGAYSGWDANRDGRISRNEFGSCWYGGGFYSGYDRNAYEANWMAFDANRDGYLSRDEYYSAVAWQRLDRNSDGRIDNNEWRWQ